MPFINLPTNNYLIAIVGPTAVGKTDTAIEVAKALSSEIVSFDSRQFYNELSIGTAKPNDEVLRKVRHHFINSLTIKEEYNASKFEKDAIRFLNEYFKKNNEIVFCGGSGMYLNAVLYGFDNELPSANYSIRKKLNSQLKDKGITYLQQQLKELDPEFFETVDINNSKRLLRAIEVCLITGKKYSNLREGKKKKRNFSYIKIGLELERELLYSRINKRVNDMMDQGLLEEVESLLNYKEKNALKTVGYQELFEYYEGKIKLEEAVEKIKTNSRRYAKRQITWFKKDNEIEWFKSGQNTQIIHYIRSRIRSK